MMDGIIDHDLSFIRNPNCINLNKLAISKADGVIIASENINSKIRDFMHKSKIPVLEYHNKNDYVDVYARFYDQILSSGVNEPV
jgi:starch synthase